ncbi:serpin-Z6B [Setaria viridis]|nr:serpin-Z6B-like [Setaria viridis]
MRSSQDQYVAEHDGFKVLRMPYTVPDPYHGILSSVRAQIVYTEAESWDVTPLPYPQFSLCIFLPDARDGLWSLEDKVLSEMGSIHEHLLLPRNRVGVGRFQVPKLKMCMSDGTSIKTVLQGLGIRALFSEEADMTNMLEHGGTGEPFFVNDVVHKAIFRVDEGDQSSEVTTTDSAARGGCLRLERQPVDFVADHPFAFFVVEEVTGAILLAGHVLDPTQVI